MDKTKFQRLGAVLSLLVFGTFAVAMLFFNELISSSEFAIKVALGVAVTSVIAMGYFLPRAVLSFRKKRAGDSWRIFW